MVSLNPLILLVVVAIHTAECQIVGNPDGTLSKVQRNNRRAVYVRCVSMAARQLHSARVTAWLERTLGNRAFAQCVAVRRKGLQRLADRLRQRRTDEEECSDVRSVYDCEKYRDDDKLCHLAAVQQACRKTCGVCGPPLTTMGPAAGTIGEPWLGMGLPPPDAIIQLGGSEMVVHTMNTCHHVGNVNNGKHFDCSGKAGKGCDEFFVSVR